MTSTTPLNVQAIVNLLERTQPGQLEQLRARHPNAQRVLSPGKMLGEEPPSPQLLVELAQATFNLAKEQGRSVSQRLRRRLRMSARLKLAGSIVSSVSSAGIIAAALQGHGSAALAAGVVAFLSAAVTSVAQYLDDFAAGGSSPRELLQTVDASLLDVFEAEGEFRLMLASGGTAGLQEMIRKLNVSVALLRQVELRFG